MHRPTAQDARSNNGGRLLLGVPWYARFWQRRHSSISYEAPLPFEAMKSPDKVSTVRG